MKAEEGMKKKDNTTLALGEVTGHSHQLFAPMQVRENDVGLAQECVLEQEGELKHEEHETLLLPKGRMRVILQREVDLLGQVRQVLD